MESIKIDLPGYRLTNQLYVRSRTPVYQAIRVSDQKKVTLYETVSDRTGLGLLWIHKLVVSYLFGTFGQALEQARQYLDAVFARMCLSIFRFYDSLAQLVLFGQLSDSQQQMEERIAANQEKLKYWAIYAPMNFQHKL
ncbi:hypothetical protein WKK05_15500 [Nostoc sp. UHCC 0302]|uniref:hypothetical protein n=1 Tax=Nostoc sp. UHCC 0302 TaxID=3134896 RepID=UPI00311CC558